MIGTFRETFELRQFPFDVQLLNFTITSAIPSNVVTLSPGKRNLRVQDLPEFNVHKFGVDTIGRKSVSSKYSGKTYHQVVITLHLERKPWNYCVNVVLMMFVLVVASFGNLL